MGGESHEHTPPKQVEPGSFKQGWGWEPPCTLSTAGTTGAEKETGRFQCAEILLCRKLAVHFFLKNTTPKGIPSSGLDETLELLHPTQHFWCLTCKSQCLNILKESPVHYFWWVSEVKTNYSAMLLYNYFTVKLFFPEEPSSGMSYLQQHPQLSQLLHGTNRTSSLPRTHSKLFLSTLPTPVAYSMRRRMGKHRGSLQD